MDAAPDPQYVNGLIHGAAIDEIKASPYFHPAPNPSEVDFFWPLRKVQSADCYAMSDPDILELTNEIARAVCASLQVKIISYPNGHGVDGLKTLNDIKEKIFQSLRKQEKW